MDRQNEARQALLRKSNYVILLISYFAAAIPISILILVTDNNPTPNIVHKIILLCVVLLIFSPAFSVSIILFRLRLEQAFVKKDLSVFFQLNDISWANPDISELLGKKGQKTLDIFVKILFVIVVIVFIGMPLRELFKLLN